jgi:2-C-methyl-D-erythritol 2,4-cyclodiphosphate synthase
MSNEVETTQISELIHQTLSDQLRLGTGADFHSLHKGYPLVLAGVSIPSDKGFHVKRSDGDPVSHALVDALLLALGKGDIADWFDDQDDIVNARSIDYLGELYEKVLASERITIISIQVVILAEEPRLKPFFAQMKNEIATRLRMDPQRIGIQGKTFEGKGIIGQQQGIEARATIMLLESK